MNVQVPSSIETFSLTSLSNDKFASLLGTQDECGTCVTLLLPMERKGPETRKNHINFKNALSEVEERLAKAGTDEETLGKILGKLSHLDDPTEDFWQHQDRGLIFVFTDSGEVSAYRVPFPLPSYVHIGPKPYLLPLLRLLNPSRYCVLVLDLNDLRLMEVTPWEAAIRPLEDIPTSLDEATKFDDPEKSLQFRSVSASNDPGPGGGDVSFHGHGVTNREYRDKNLKRFFEMIDKGLPASLPDRQTPLVLFGPESHIGLYGEVNSYEHLLDESIPFNPGDLQPSELESRVIEFAAERERKLLETYLDELEQHLAQQQATIELEEIVLAAIHGRVSRLFIATGESRPGFIDEENNRVIVGENDPSGKGKDPRELVGDTATAAALTGADIRFVDELKLPGEAAMAAVLRY